MNSIVSLLSRKNIVSHTSHNSTEPAYILRKSWCQVSPRMQHEDTAGHLILSVLSTPRAEQFSHWFLCSCIQDWRPFRNGCCGVWFQIFFCVHLFFYSCNRCHSGSWPLWHVPFFLSFHPVTWHSEQSSRKHYKGRPSFDVVVEVKLRASTWWMMESCSPAQYAVNFPPDFTWVVFSLNLLYVTEGSILQVITL